MGTSKSTQFFFLLQACLLSELEVGLKVGSAPVHPPNSQTSLTLELTDGPCALGPPPALPTHVRPASLHVQEDSSPQQ